MKQIITVLITIILLSTIVTASATTSRELIKSQYGDIGDWIGIGERLYKITDSSGKVSYELNKGSLILGMITSNIPATKTIDPGDSVSWNVKITGCCEGLDGNPSHIHKLKLYNDDTGAEIKNTDSWNVFNGDSIDGGVSLGKFTTKGTYKYRIKEFILLQIQGSYEEVWSSGNTIYLTVQVGSISTPVPTVSPTAVVTVTPTSSPTVTTTASPTTSPTASPTSTMSIEITCPLGTVWNEESYSCKSLLDNVTNTSNNTNAMYIIAILGIIAAFILLRKK